MTKLETVELRCARCGYHRWCEYYTVKAIALCRECLDHVILEDAIRRDDFRALE